MSNPLEPYGQQPPGPSGGPPHQPRPYDGPTGTYGGPPGQPRAYGPPGQPSAYGSPPGQPGGYGPGGPPAQPPYGQPHPYGYSNGYGYGYGPPGGGPPADWGSRVGASLIDSLLLAVPLIPGYVLALVLNGGNDELGAAGGIALGAAYLGCFVVWLWNRVIRQGRTGQSVGKRVLGLRLVGESTGQVIGVGRTLGRELMAGIFNNICFLNCLWPLWDDKQQTWHDKVVSTIVVKL